jgi:hypothetical protein
MFSENAFRNRGSFHSDLVGSQARSFSFNIAYPRKLIIGLILLVALVAFEIFNYDTTRYALQSLLGDANFMGLLWATVLAIAFCAIDFAGLARLFTPEQGHNEPRAVWYLMGAWLLGATMNAMMTWWAVNLTLLNHDLGNEILSREELLRFVPLFVAVLVWLTRILFIGAFSIAGDHIFDLAGQSTSQSVRKGQRKGSAQQLPANDSRSELPAARPIKPQPKSRIRRQPQAPGSGQAVPVGMQAQGRNR